MTPTEQTTRRTVWTTYGTPALEALRTAVGNAKRADPMTPVTVVVPNNIAGIVARRALATGVGGRPGVTAIEFTTLPRLAERVALPTIGARRPITRVVLAAAWRTALATNPGRFAEIADHPATVRALAQAHQELRELDADTLLAVSATNGVTGGLVRLHNEVVAALSENWYDTVDVLLSGADNPPQLGTVIRYLPQTPTLSEQRFADALTLANDVTEIVALTGDEHADRGILHGLPEPSDTDRPKNATATRIANSSDADDEIRVVIRDLMSALQTTPAHRIAILYTSREAYPRLLHEHLAAAGITVNGAGVRPVDERALSRTLLEILALADHDLPRGGLFRALSNAPVRDFTGKRITLTRWERISRKAGVTGGDDWARRIDALTDDCRARIDAERAADDPTLSIIGRYENDIVTALELSAFAQQLRSRFVTAAELTSWADLAAWCSDLMATLLGAEIDGGRLPVEEQYAAVAIRSALSGIAGLDAIGGTADLTMLRDLLESELSAAIPRTGRFSEGVLVAPLSAAIGLDLDLVYLVGCSEDLLPGRLRADGLLPDAARERSNGRLTHRRERLDAQHRYLLAAMSCATTSVASFPRGDLRRSTRRLPSRFLLPSLRKLAHDDQLAATEWDRPSYGPELQTAHSFAAGLLTADPPGNEQEWRTRLVAANDNLDDATFRRAIEMNAARTGNDFTRYDGNLTGIPGLPNPAGGSPMAPTTLEQYAECPHTYFVQRLLGVRPIEEPESIIAIPPTEIGNVIHESVDRFISETTDRPAAGMPWSAVQIERLVEIGAERAAEAERRGLTGHPRLWEPEKRRILEDLRWLLSEDSHQRAADGTTVLASEMSFGKGGIEPISITLDGGVLKMRGSADLVHRGSDGALFVTDLKTGSNTRFKDISPEDATVGGTRLQLPAYAYAARMRYGTADTPVKAEYWFVRKSRGRIELELTPLVDQEYRRVLSILVASIANGLFPPRPPATASYGRILCSYCDPDGLGHTARRKAWERKRSGPQLADLVGLVEPGSQGVAS